jgi:hypothetical protein
MSALNSSPDIVAVKDGSIERKVPSSWRPVFEDVVRAFVKEDYRLRTGIPGVEEVSAETETHIRNSIRSYGATLTELPNETWESSVCMWYETYWDVLVDLWTQDEGRSDLVLSVRVTEGGDGFSFRIHMVYVP